MISALGVVEVVCAESGGILPSVMDAHFPQKGVQSLTRNLNF